LTNGDDVSRATSLGRSPRRQSTLGNPVSTLPDGVRVGAVLQIRTLAGEFGLDFPELLATAGAAPDVFDDPEARLATDMLGRLLESCARHANCPHFGLLVGRRFEATSLGDVNGLMKNCTSVRQALSLGTAHLHLTDHGAMSFMFDVGDGRAALGYALLAGVIPGADHIQDGGLTMLYLLVREICGPSWRPLLVRLSRERPAELKPYRAVFGDKLEFEADLSAIIFDSRWLGQPISGASNEAFNAAARAIRSQEASDPVVFSRQVRRAIHALLFSSSASTSKIARTFDLAPRTLRRRLAEEGETVRSLTSDVRRELSFHLLKDTNLKLSEVAAALRYADAAVFSRAFRSWTNMSPRRWRALATGQQQKARR
jgi:AraC-like DNA-binding protein